MYFIAAACAVNIGLDFLFMGPLHLGPTGAALGTTLSPAVSVAVSLLVIVKRNTGIALTKADLWPDRAVMGRLLKIGVPVALQDGFIQVSFMVITIIANRRGLTDAAAVGIAEKMMSFLFLVPSSMLSTVSALGAQNIGAGKTERAQAAPLWEIQLVLVPACRLFWVDTSLSAENYSDLELSTSRLAPMQAEAVVFLGKVGFSISAAHLKARQYGQYDGTFLLLDEDDAFVGVVMDYPETLCVRIRFRGHHLQSPDQYRRLEAYMAEHRLAVAGFSREIAIIDQGFTYDRDKFITEICIPVEKLKQ